MPKTNEYNEINILAVDTTGLMRILSCGESTARAIAERAQARIPNTGRRTLYSVEKINNYIKYNSY